MKCRIMIDPDREEEVVIYTHTRTPLVEQIEALITNEQERLIGYRGDRIVPLDPAHVCCLTVEDGRVYALTTTEKLWIKERLYALEERLGDAFLKINQSCLINVRRIKCFSASIGGALSVTLENGFCDYISRRQLRQVKERMGL